MKDIIYKMKYLKKVVYSSKGSPLIETCNYPENVLHLQKEQQN